MAYKDLVQKLTKELALYQQMGGNIYAPRRELPYYERLRSASRAYERETGEKIAMEQVYSDCGIKFDRDYYYFSEFVSGLSQIATPEGYVDSIKSNKAPQQQVELRSYLDFHANEVGLAPGEYLILMTDYRYQNLTISGDYISYLQEKFSKAYPTGKVKNLKAENTSLYWGLKHFQEYAPFELSYEDALAFFGMENISARKGPSPTTGRVPDESKILEELRETYPNGNVEGIYKDNPKLYYSIVRLAVSQDLPINTWFTNHNIAYPQGNDVARFSKFKVDAKEHEEKLITLRDKYLEEYGDLSEMDSMDLYRIHLDVAKKISAELYGEKNMEDEETVEETSTPEQTPQLTHQQPELLETSSSHSLNFEEIKNNLTTKKDMPVATETTLPTLPTDPVQ